MTKKEQLLIYNQFSETTLNIYAGILFNNQEFKLGNNEEIKYNFTCPEFIELKEKYDLIKIAGKGTDYKKAKRLLHYFAPKLTHSPWYDNHIACNALDLLEYSFNNPKQGINCLNKSKVFQECCLAIGIYARRVSLMPYSPYDFDNHVVTEIYDRGLGKWIMLDPTTDGLFVDENGTPLSLIEMRYKFANDKFITFVKSTDNYKNLKQLKEKYLYQNSYICKNLFYFCVDQDSTFSTTNKTLAFIPKGYSINEKTKANLKYRMNHLPEEYKDWIPKYEEQLKSLKDQKEIERTSIYSMEKSPIK